MNQKKRLKLFKHYKEKPYKYLGEVVHSETLEKLVLYECLYENELSSLWVRPKDLFFGELEIGGENHLRFRPIEFEFLEETQLDENRVNQIVELLEEVFGAYDKKKLYEKLNDRKQILLVSAFDKDRFVGFKLGYELDQKSFYSWLGAVHPDYQGLGLGQELMNSQHQWARENHYATLKTKTFNRWQSMIVLNIKNGFEIVGTEKSLEGLTKILLEKTL